MLAMAVGDATLAADLNLPIMVLWITSYRCELCGRTSYFVGGRHSGCLWQIEMPCTG